MFCGTSWIARISPFGSLIHFRQVAKLVVWVGVDCWDPLMKGIVT